MSYLKYPARLLIYWISLLILCITNSTSFAISTPDKDFLINNDGTVTHKVTGLIWQRCAEGQQWKNNTCLGNANIYNFDEASKISHTDNQQTYWRLPAISELITIVEWEGSYTGSTGINETIFPNTPKTYFWSATTWASFPLRAWVLSFSRGDDMLTEKTEQHHVRLVRGVSQVNAQGESTATEHFIDHGDGTVTHKNTGLMWQRCSVGQLWNGKTCQGNPTNFRYFEIPYFGIPLYEWSSITYISGYDNWRMPKLHELKSLVEYKNVSPAINASIFPNTPSISYWIDSLGYQDPYTDRVVDFTTGLTSSGRKLGFDGNLIIQSGGEALPLRLVRIANQPDNAHYDPKSEVATVLDVRVDDEHYQISLLNRGNNLFSLTEAYLLTVQQHERSAIYSQASEYLIIPKIQVGTKFYSAGLKNTGAYIFKLDTLKEITQLSGQ